ncbi:MAG TPA: flavodoxin-dependent (E)-4-hydroxy-3-methylbut-2-enyl-diphosphate synthase, partial [Chitinophagaceae bacterium]
KDLVKRYDGWQMADDGKEIYSVDSVNGHPSSVTLLPYDPFNYQRRETFAIDNIGGKHVPVVIADLSKIEKISRDDLKNIGYTYAEDLDKWNIADAAADYIFTERGELDFALPGTLKVIQHHKTWVNTKDKEKYFPILDGDQYLNDECLRSSHLNFVMIDCFSQGLVQSSVDLLFNKLKGDATAAVCLSSTNKNAMQSIRRMFIEVEKNGIRNPAIIICDSNDDKMNESLTHYSVEVGALLLEGFCDGVCIGHHFGNKNIATDYWLMNSIAFSLLQATRTRISKTEYISCPSCGRTLFDLQETTASIRAVTNHLKGVKIAIMGCIVNGPGEMADADFGYVGSGPGKITLYKGKEIVKRNVNSEVAVEELINLLKENEAWVEP